MKNQRTMNYELRITNSKGFSLIEVLLAVGILAVAMLFIGGTFLVGIHFSTIATEQTIAAVAADEAFAKIRIYGINLSVPSLSFNAQSLFENVVPVPAGEFAYPSTNTVAPKQYYWSALCRRADITPDSNLVQVTVFVCRKIGSGSARSVPVRINIQKVVGSDRELEITDANEALINDGYTIVDNVTGGIYRVLERYANTPNIIQLDRFWLGGLSGSVWVVPPPSGSGRYPCIAVYQKVISF
jgi:prepilin-type N-terminal cleavage/methylation domain-containing protein